MLRPIPSRILSHTATVSIPTGVDAYQAPLDPTVYTVSKVCLQPSNTITLSGTMATAQLSATLFVDARKSTPALDWFVLFEQANSINGQIQIECQGRNFTLKSVDRLVDDDGNLHHWELGLQ